MAPGTGSSPFGDGRRPGRLKRALVYFGLNADPTLAPDASPEVPTPERVGQRADPSKRATRGRQALVYFGLADDEPASRYGPAVSPALDDDVAELRRRVEALERELGRRRGGG